MVRINIGNFPPLSEAVLRVYYFQNLEIEDMSYCLRVPTTYIPKYMANVNRILRGEDISVAPITPEPMNDEATYHPILTDAPYVWDI